MNPLAPLVPRLWTPEEALAAVTMLNTAVDAIWQVHGEAMVGAVADDPDRWPLDGLVNIEVDAMGDLPADEDLPY
jgi:hypothetical protein